MQKSIGFLLIVIGGLMMAYTGFNYFTTEKVVDLGPIKINKEKEHFVGWSPIAGVVLLLGGFIIIANSRKTST